MHHSKQSEKIASAKTTNVVADKMTPTIVSFMKNEKAPAPVLSAALKINKAEKASTKKSYGRELNKHIVLQSNVVNPKNVVPAKTITQENAVQQKRNGGGDANLILLVILSLFPFINLIAMYLHDGKSVTTNFWVDLILDILFFVPGIVFALLVVLDVVNLA